MWRKKSKYLVMSLFALLMFFGLSSSNDTKVTSPDTAKADDVTVVPKYTPSSDPWKLGFLTLSSGYDLQPVNQYTYMGQPVTLSVHVALTLGDTLLLTSSRQWYQSNNPTSSSNWSTVKGGTSNKLTINPSSIGTTYYQDTYKRGSIWPLTSNFYSKVAFITTLPEPVPATGVSVKVDDDYLYNNQSDPMTTFARATPTPYNTTSPLTWSVDDTSLATVDSTTGEITPNKNGKNGTVYVTGTYTNLDGSKIQDSAPVKIGGGLDDQTVDEGKTATFDIQGDFPNQATSIVWHKIIDNKDSVISGATKKSYTTPETLYSDNKSQFYAVMKVPSVDSSGNATTETITTNKATLTVNADTTPRVIIKSNVYNTTYNDHNAEDTEINSVIAGDQLVIKGTVNDENKNSIMQVGAIGVRIPQNMNADTVLVDGQDADNYYIIADPTDPTYALVKIPTINFTNTKSHTYTITMTAADNQNLSLVTTPRLNGTDADENEIDATYEGNPLTINFSDDQLSAKAHDIDYGSLQYSSVGKPLTGDVDETDNTAKDLLKVSDNRRNKTAAQIYLSQTSPFTSGSDELPSELRFYKSDGTYQKLSGEDALISDTAAGDKVGSVGNTIDEGLKLYIFNGKIVNGQYSSTLNWTVVDAPQ